LKGLRPLLAVLPMTGLAVLLATFDGAVLTLALAAIAHDFRASVGDLSRLGALLALGSLGSLPLAWLADRSGRRRVIALGVAGFGAANLLSALAPSLVVLALVRFAAVCFESLVLSVSTALVVEETPSEHRGQAVAAITILAGAGTFLTVLAYPLLAPHWRVLYVAGGIALPASALVWRFLPEGGRWSAARITSTCTSIRGRVHRRFCPGWRAGSTCPSTGTGRRRECVPSWRKRWSCICGGAHATG